MLLPLSYIFSTFFPIFEDKEGVVEFAYDLSLLIILLKDFFINEALSTMIN
jgi:hypothetical protein